MLTNLTRILFSLGTECIAKLVMERVLFASNDDTTLTLINLEDHNNCYAQDMCVGSVFKEKCLKLRLPASELKQMAQRKAAARVRKRVRKVRRYHN